MLEHSSPGMPASCAALAPPLPRHGKAAASPAAPARDRS